MLVPELAILNSTLSVPEQAGRKFYVLEQTLLVPAQALLVPELMPLNRFFQEKQMSIPEQTTTQLANSLPFRASVKSFSRLFQSRQYIIFSSSKKKLNNAK